MLGEVAAELGDAAATEMNVNDIDQRAGPRPATSELTLELLLAKGDVVASVAP